MKFIVNIIIHFDAISSTAQICTAGVPYAGLVANSMWVPTSNSVNNWISIGQQDADKACKSYYEQYATSPTWGNQSATFVARSYLYCCAVGMMYTACIVFWNEWFSYTNTYTDATINNTCQTTRTETCNGIDDDCDGLIDNFAGVSPQTNYQNA